MSELDKKLSRWIASQARIDAIEDFGGTPPEDRLPYTNGDLASTAYLDCIGPEKMAMRLNTTKKTLKKYLKVWDKSYIETWNELCAEEPTQ